MEQIGYAALMVPHNETQLLHRDNSAFNDDIYGINSPLLPQVIVKETFNDELP